jgi:hypothetical protein
MFSKFRQRLGENKIAQYVLFGITFIMYDQSKEKVVGSKITERLNRIIKIG